MIRASAVRLRTLIPGLVLTLVGLAPGGFAVGQEAPSALWKEAASFKDDLRKAESTKDISRKKHSFPVRAGGLYIIHLRSNSSPGKEHDFDTYLRLFDSKGILLAEDDDSGGGTDSRLIYLAPRSEVWTIEVSNFFPGERGEYECVVQAQNPETNGQESSYLGKLSKSDPTDWARAGCRVHGIHLWMESGKKYVIDLRSKEFDAFLRLEDLHRKELAFDDDSGGDLNARLTYVPVRTGTHLLLATTYVPASVGNYTLSIRSEPLK